MKAQTVSFIGAGNLAWHLAQALDNTDYAVREVYSRNKKNAEALVSNLYSAEVNPTLDFSASTSQIFIIAVPDDAIQGIAQKLVLPDNAVLVHTSGSQPLSLLGYSTSANIGVLYPLQTFSKSKKVDFADIPFFIESENNNTDKVLVALAKSISKKVFKITSKDRKALHVSAVFAANFTNHMLFIAQEIMKENKLSFDWLKPLIAEMINKSLSIGPENAQTGPARRGDLEILDNHLKFLEKDEQVAEIYKVVSQHIVDQYDAGEI
jgi:predicted short-subunit dehydrogenase-like oxidoreductase (DUF2520 family)